MSYRLLRFLIIIIGLGALGGFGWRFYDFIQRRAELLGRYDLAKLVESVDQQEGAGPSQQRRPYDDFRLTYALNVTGILPPPEADPDNPPPPPPPLVGPNDVRLDFVITGAVMLAYLSPTQEGPQAAGTEGLPGQGSGGLYAVGDRFELPTKKGVELEVLAIRQREAELGIVGKEDGGFTLVLEEALGDTSSLFAAEGEQAVPRRFPTRTTAVGGNQYEVGTEDLEQLGALSDDQLLASIKSRPKVGRDGKVIGQQITSLGSDSPLKNFGLRENDVVLDVNGVPASDRASLVRRLRAMGEVDEVSVRLERLGSVRTYTYRLPPRR